MTVTVGRASIDRRRLAFRTRATDLLEPMTDTERPVQPTSKVLPVGEMPDRDTPEAVIRLVRLARANPILDGVLIGPRLLSLAAMLNAKLPIAQRVPTDDPRLNEAIESAGRALAESAVATIGKYIMNPAIAPTLDARGKAFIVLGRYFTWCRGLWKAVESTREVVDAFTFDYETMCPTDDIGEHSLGAILHWLASLCVVIEGWEELELSDTDIDARLMEGGDIKTDGSPRHRLQRLRNGVFHFQVSGTEDARFTDFWNTDVVRWAIPLERAFERFFRQAWESRQESLEPWLYRGLVPRFDPDLTPPDEA